MAQEPDRNIDPDSVGPRGTKRYESRASEYLTDASKTRSLLEDAQEKAGHTNVLASMWDDFSALTRMIRAYAEGTYRKVPWTTVLTATAAIVYFVVPTDFIPDFIAGLGLLDDAAVLAWTLKSLKVGLNAFRAWEESQGPDPTKTEL
jgi:uncharacterized membrane protein YkvA (DUF1232 family)